MTRGNQRDLNRARAEKKHAKHGGKSAPDGPVAQRKANDADIMRQKQQAAASKKAEEGDNKAKGNIYLQPNDNNDRNKVTNQRKN